jgi:hypothetical protein
MLESKYKDFFKNYEEEFVKTGKFGIKVYSKLNPESFENELRFIYRRILYGDKNDSKFKTYLKNLFNAGVPLDIYFTKIFFKMISDFSSELFRKGINFKDVKNFINNIDENFNHILKLYIELRGENSKNKIKEKAANFEKVYLDKEIYNLFKIYQDEGKTLRVEQFYKNMLITVYTKEIFVKPTYIDLKVKDIMLALAYETKEIFIKFEESKNLLCKVTVDKKNKLLSITEIAKTELDFTQRKAKRVSIQEYILVSIFDEENNEIAEGNLIDLSLEAAKINLQKIIDENKTYTLIFKLKNREVKVKGKVLRKENSDYIFKFSLDIRSENIISSYIAEVEMKLLKELKNKYLMIFEG